VSAAPRAVAERYVAWLNDHPADHPEIADALLAPAFTWTEAPTRFSPTGRGGDRATMVAALAEAAAALASETLEVQRITEGEGTAVVELLWTGLPRGASTPLRGRGALCLDVVDGRVVAARDYLCLEG
jgi:ketosteroid isomerase-like protein